MLLCTVGTELLPEIVKAEGWAQNLAAFIGFFFGVAVLILLGMFAPDTEPEEQEKDQRTKQQAEEDGDIDFGVFESPTPEQRLQIRQSKFVIAGRRFRQRQTIRSNSGKLVIKRSMSLSSLPTVTESDALLSHSDTPGESSYTSEDKPKGTYNKEETDHTEGKNKDFPLQFLLAVAIDSCLDGLLIGIASAAGKSAGPMMSASLSVEMGFLGLTLATTLSGQPAVKASLAALAGPFCREYTLGLVCCMPRTPK